MEATDPRDDLARLPWQVRPVPAEGDEIYRCLRDRECPSDTGLTLALGKPADDCADLDFRELPAPVTLAPDPQQGWKPMVVVLIAPDGATPAFGIPVGNVVPVRAQEEMALPWVRIRENAGRHVAVVEYRHAGRDRAVDTLPCQPVRAMLAATNLRHAVTVPVHGTHPQQAAGVRFRCDAFQYRLGRRGLNEPMLAQESDDFGR